MNVYCNSKLSLFYQRERERERERETETETERCFIFSIYFICCSTSVTEEFKLNTYDSNDAADKAVESVRHNFGGTKTDAAIQYAVDNIFPVSDGGRLGSVKV